MNTANMNMKSVVSLRNGQRNKKIKNADVIGAIVTVHQRGSRKNAPIRLVQLEKSVQHSWKKVSNDNRLVQLEKKSDVENSRSALQ
jgi:hypothetical protein